MDLLRHLSSCSCPSSSYNTTTSTHTHGYGHIYSYSYGLPSPLRGPTPILGKPRPAFLASPKSALPQSQTQTQTQMQTETETKTQIETQQVGQHSSLSARARRKLRNERRTELSKEAPSWREEVENLLFANPEGGAPRKMKKVSSAEKRDVNRLARLGVQWWMVFTPRHMEVSTAERMTAALSTILAPSEFEVFVPFVPSKRKLKDGNISEKRSTLHRNCVFFRTIMNRQVFDTVKEVPGVRGFFGTKVGHLVVFVMPSPIALEEVEMMKQKVREEEEDLKKCIKESKENKKENKKEDKEAGLMDGAESNGVVESTGEENSPLVYSPKIGDEIKVLAGPYTNFEGQIVELHEGDGKVKAVLWVFGEDTHVDFNINEVECKKS